MAKSPEGILGAFTGKAGNVVGYILNGQAIIRSLPKRKKKKRKPTPLESNNRGKMKLLSLFFSRMRGFLELTFTPESRGTVYNWYNLAVKYNNPTAIKGTFPGLEIDYPNVVLSRGDLRQPVNPKVERTTEGVKFSWDVTNLDSGSHDQAMLLICFPDDHSASSSGGNVRRGIGMEIIPMDAKSLKMRMETYICFVSNDRQRFSNSLYLGALEAIPEEETTTKKTVKKVVKTVAKVVSAPAELSPEKITDHKILAVARNLKALGTLSDRDIANATGLTMEEVETCI